MIEKPELVILVDGIWLKRQKIAGRCIRNIFKEIELLLLSGGTISLKDLETLSLKYIDLYGCTPTFLNYKGFPSAICTSVNNQLVHGIVTDYILKSGDVVSVDIGVTYEGAIADAARTWIFGEPKTSQHVSLINSCKRALKEAVSSIGVGKQLGVIGNAISKVAAATGFNVITDYGGHGLYYNTPHCSPFVENRQKPNVGIRMVNGLSIAIEPMFVIGDTRTTVSKEDKWTVYTKDIGVHFEDTVTLFDDELHLITDAGE
jgi:methionyl aminopeptidase